MLTCPGYTGPLMELTSQTGSSDKKTGRAQPNEKD